MKIKKLFIKESGKMISIFFFYNKKLKIFLFEFFFFILKYFFRFHGIGVLFNHKVKDDYDQDFISYNNLNKYEDFWVKYHGDF
jgi:hypothetical protein